MPTFTVRPGIYLSPTGDAATINSDGAGGFDIVVTAPTEQAGTYNVSAADITMADGAPILVVAPVEAA